MRCAVVVVLLCSAVLAQTPTHNPSQHTMTQETIDGSKTPNLIPDSAAWRLWLLVVSADYPSHPERAVSRRHAFLMLAGVPEDELIIADDVLTHFKNNYQELVDDYNRRMTAQQSPSLADFKMRRDTLVQTTKDTLSGQLAHATFAHLKAHINAEKARMQVAKGDAQ